MGRQTQRGESERKDGVGVEMRVGGLGQGGMGQWDEMDPAGITRV